MKEKRSPHTGSGPGWVAATALLACLLALTPPACARNAPLSDATRRDQIEHLYRRYKRSFSTTPELTVDELITRQAATHLVLVDVRTGAEREVSMIPGAITAEEFEQNKEAYRDAQVVAYCTIGARSGEYAEALRKDGFQAFNLRGSILAWAHAGEPLVTETGATRRVHVYGPAWDLAPQAYPSVW